MGYTLLANGIYWGCNPLINLLLTSWDIQVLRCLDLRTAGHGCGWICPFPSQTYDDLPKWWCVWCNMVDESYGTNHHAANKKSPQKQHIQGWKNGWFFYQNFSVKKNHFTDSSRLSSRRTQLHGRLYCIRVFSSFPAFFCLTDFISIY